jgi:serine O-acetyltransferase
MLGPMRTPRERQLNARCDGQATYEWKAGTVPGVPTYFRGSSIPPDRPRHSQAQAETARPIRRAVFVAQLANMSVMDTVQPSSARPPIEEVAAHVLASYDGEPRTRHIDAGPLPGRSRAIELLEMLRDLAFPGYFTRTRLTAQNVRDHVVRLVADIRETLEQQVELALTFHDSRAPAGAAGTPPPGAPRKRAELITDEFLVRIPRLRQLLALDVQAAYEGDPAARSTDETIFCYPGVDAVFTYRMAHELHGLGVPLLPRIMSEYVHNETGIDIHPGATIGRSFFIDHGTGVVIGETTHIGDRVKLYQGVTLGAMSFPKDAAGRLIRGTKRHPTLEDDVTVYANAIILGGNTIIGKGCIIGGSVFLTKSVPPGHYVTLKSQELKYRSAETHNRLFTVTPAEQD